MDTAHNRMTGNDNIDKIKKRIGGEQYALRRFIIG